MYQRGLTLIEVLIATLVFSLIAVASYRVLSGTLLLSARVDTASEARETLGRVAVIIRSDIEQMLDRSVQRGGETLDALELHNPASRKPGYLEFTRGGNHWPGEHQAGLLRVRYQVSQHPDRSRSDSPWFGDKREHLLRLTWAGLDQVKTDHLQVDVLLEDVTTWQLEAGDGSSRYRQWPLAVPVKLRPPLQTLRWLELELDSASTGPFTTRVLLH